MTARGNAGRRPRGVWLPPEGRSHGGAPPIASSQSPLSSVSACGENCVRSLAPPLPTARGAAGAPHRDIKKRMRRARWKRKSASAGRSAQAQTSCRRRGMVGGPLRQSGTETPSPWGGLWPGEVWDTSSSSFRCRWPVVDESSSKEPTQQPLRVPRGARSEAERAERGADQMRPCTPLTSVPAPRESAVKCAPYPAAPVGRLPKMRRHHLTSTPVAQRDAAL